MENDKKRETIMMNFAKKTFAFALAVVISLSFTQIAFAKESTITPTGSVYEFGEKDHYEFSSSTSGKSANSINTLGSFSLSGDMTDKGTVNGVQTFVVSSGNLSFSYDYDGAILDAEDTEWHLIDDKTKQIDDFSVDKNILSGAVVVQSSKDGDSWITDVQLTDAFDDTEALSESIYTTKDVQLENGCYYRVIVVYKEEIKTGEKSGVFGIGTSDVTESKKIAEVYSFYVVSSSTYGNTMSASDSPRKEIASKPINTGKDNGFSGNKSIDKDDPHFGWELGTFVINGYTRETTYNGSSVFLKNVGDKVTLWFTLEQDINTLNGKSTLSINEDTNGYDQEFGIAQTNMGHGCLIISYTDYEGNTHDPIIYTDFLAANATTGADTRVQLFEEGDYTVTLDYEIKNNPRQVGPVSVAPSYTNYKIEFSFSIRNGNCMVYPFDTVTSNELSDNAITGNGFRLDMAKSRYLNIDVTRTVLNVGADGILTEDVRFNRPAKDSDSYTDDGIYTFEVSNLYTGSTTTKTIYVGSDPYLRALSKYGISVEALNESIANGATIADDGTIVGPVEEPETEEEPVVTEEETEPSQEIEETESDFEEVTETDSAESELAEDTTTMTETEEQEVAAENTTATSPILFAIIGVVVVGGIGAIVSIRKKGKNKEGDAE